MLAEKLGMTVARLETEATPVELLEWRAFFNVRTRLLEREQERNRAKRA